MKYFFTLLAAFLFAGSLQAQNMNDHWTLSLNKKILFAGNEEIADAARSINIFPAKKDFAKGTFKIAYLKVKPDDTWKRSLMIYDQNDRLLAEQQYDADTGVWNIAIADFKKYIAGQKKISVYTTAIPKDPNMAAMVRVRRILLCTVNVK
jgi:hypothetical protein